MRCPVPLLAAWCWVALPHALHAQPAPPPPPVATETVPLEAGETKGQLPVGAPATPAGPGARARSGDEPGVVQPGEEDEVGAAPDGALPSGESGDRSRAPGSAASSTELNELHARVEAIGRGEPLDDSVQRPLDFARAALERSRASHAVGDGASAQRTQKLARAAVELAEARLRLLRERSLYLAARGRHDGASAELAVAQRALERERARARELARASAVP